MLCANRWRSSAQHSIARTSLPWVLESLEISSVNVIEASSVGRHVLFEIPVGQHGNVATRSIIMMMIFIESR